MKGPSVVSLAFILFLFLCSSCSSINRTTEDFPAQPNIVWITSEDNSAHYLKLFFEGGVATPNIERLASGGVIFSHAFSNAPVCSVARSTLITGCYAPRLFGNFHRKIEPVSLPDSIKMFPAYLRKAGYYTANNAKEDYNYHKADDVWDESSKGASWKKREDGQPFFYVHNFHVSHEGQLHFDADKIEDGLPGVDVAKIATQPNHPDTETFRFTKAYYQNRVQTMDAEVGELLDEFEKAGILENTIIFYFGDHGGVLPGSKGYLYETGLHVPLVVYVPEQYRASLDVEAGSRNDGFVSFIDFSATVLNLAGIKVPDHMDGKPFMGRDIDAEKVQTRDVAFGYADRFDEKYDMVRSVRKGPFKYIRSYQPFLVDGLMNNYRYKQLAYADWWNQYKSGNLNDKQAHFFRPRRAEMLFNVEKDPYETVDLSLDPTSQSQLQEMRDLLENWQNDMPDLSFFPEHVLIENAASQPLNFGEEHSKELKRYRQIANHASGDLSDLKPFLESKDPWDRYWAITTAMTGTSEVSSLTTIIADILRSDAEPLNRMAAATYLTINDMPVEEEVILQILYSAKKPAELLHLLNSVVLLRDFHGLSLPIDFGVFEKSMVENNEVSRRVEYLTSS